MARPIPATPAQQHGLLALQQLDSRIAQLEQRLRERPEQRAVEASAAALRAVARDLTRHADRLDELRAAGADAVAGTAVATIAAEIAEAQQRMAEARASGEALAGEHRALVVAAAADEEARAAELVAARDARRRAADAVDATLLETYEHARRRLGGLAVVPVVGGGSCGGCRLAIPAMELEDVRRIAETAMPECPECGRFLVVPQG